MSEIFWTNYQHCVAVQNHHLNREQVMRVGAFFKPLDNEHTERIVSQTYRVSTVPFMAEKRRSTRTIATGQPTTCASHQPRHDHHHRPFHTYVHACVSVRSFITSTKAVRYD